VSRRTAIKVFISSTDVTEYVLEGEVRHGADGASSATIRLAPGFDNSTGLLDQEAVWEVHLVSYATGGSGSFSEKLFRGLARSVRMRRELQIPTLRYQANAEVVLEDLFTTWREAGTHREETVEHSSLHEELERIAQGVRDPSAPGGGGGIGVVTNLPAVAIDKIIYTREQSTLDALSPYHAPFAPLFFLEAVDGRLRVYDPDAPIDGTGDFATLSDINDLQMGGTVRGLVTQARVVYRSAYDPADGPDRPLTPNRVDTDRRREDDGTWTVTEDHYCDLKEDEDDPDKVTRSVLVKQVVSRSSGTSLTSEQTTTYEYRHDYTQPSGSESVLRGVCDLPYAGRGIREIERVTLRTDWEEDPKQAGRYLRKRVTRRTYGLYVAPYVAGLLPAALKAYGTPVKVGTWNGSVDTSATSSQTYAEDWLRTEVETYNRDLASGMVAVVGVETDDLRGVTVREWDKPELGDTGVRPGDRAEVEWLDDDGEAGAELRAVTIDATAIGLSLGLRLARRMLTQSAAIRRNGSFRLVRPKARIRRGATVTLSGTPEGYDAKYLVTAVHWQFASPLAADVFVTQRVEVSEIPESGDE
jgi:hypothetical protein